MLKNAHYRKKVIAFIKAKNIIRIKKYRIEIFNSKNFLHN